MPDTIIVAIIGAIASLGGGFLGVMAANKLSQWRIEQLEKKVEQHDIRIDKLENTTLIHDVKINSLKEEL